MLSLFSEFNKKNKIKKVGKAFKAQLGRISLLVSSGKRNEEETRRWCLDVLKSGMGYKDAEIETESKVLGQRVDIALKRSGKVFLVIECKAASIKINKAAVNQAATYAIGLGAEWAAVTNGHNWKLFHVSPTKGVEPDVVEIFDISILDEDGVSDDDCYCFYLLTAEAIFSGETKLAFHDVNSMTPDRIHASLIDQEVMTLLCKKMMESYKNNMGVVVEILPDEVTPYIDEIFEATKG